MKIKDLFQSIHNQFNEAVSISNIVSGIPSKVKPLINEWNSVTGVPKNVLWLYAKIGNDQRGAPEISMMKAQQVIGGGSLSYLIEHIGDLTNRATPMHSIGYAHESLINKVNKCLKIIRTGYGINMEIDEQLRNTASMRGIDYDTLVSSVKSSLDLYTKAHGKLLSQTSVLPPVYKYTVNAAVALGKMDFNTCETYLTKIKLECGTFDGFVNSLKKYNRSLDKFISHDEVLNENKRDLFESVGGIITVYHGDDFNTRSLEPRLMNNGNNQEGVGIYFSDRLETTKAYGKNIIKADINMRNFIDSRIPISKAVSKHSIMNIMYDMAKVDREAMFYLVTDYGVYLEEPEELEKHHIDEIYDLISGEEVRNFQTMLAGTFGVEAFVKSWNKHTGIDGSYQYHNSSERWFAIINPRIKVVKVT